MELFYRFGIGVTGSSEEAWEDLCYDPGEEGRERDRTFKDAVRDLNLNKTEHIVRVGFVTYHTICTKKKWMM